MWFHWRKEGNILFHYSLQVSTAKNYTTLQHTWLKFWLFTATNGDFKQLVFNCLEHFAFDFPVCEHHLLWRLIFHHEGALFNSLKQHPGIVTPHRETHFFDREETFEKGIDFYKSQMPKSHPHEVTLEKVLIQLLEL